MNKEAAAGGTPNHSTKTENDTSNDGGQTDTNQETNLLNQYAQQMQLAHDAFSADVKSMVDLPELALVTIGCYVDPETKKFHMRILNNQLPSEIAFGVIKTVNDILTTGGNNVKVNGLSRDGGKQGAKQKSTKNQRHMRKQPKLVLKD